MLLNSGNLQYGNTTGERIQWLRKSHNMTRYELCKKLNEYNPSTKIAYTTIQGWEEGKIPRDKNLQALSKLFSCSVDFLLCKTDDLSYLVDSLSLVKLEDIELYDGEPVWITAPDSSNFIVGNYALINCSKEYFIFNDGSIRPFSSLSEKAKIYSRSMHSTYRFFDPLPLKTAMELSSVYITEKNASPETSKYAGYYSYNHHTQCFEKDDHTIILKDSGYNISYVAYEKPLGLKIDL